MAQVLPYFSDLRQEMGDLRQKQVTVKDLGNCRKASYL